MTNGQSAWEDITAGDAAAFGIPSFEDRSKEANDKISQEFREKEEKKARKKEKKRLADEAAGIETAPVAVGLKDSHLLEALSSIDGEMLESPEEMLQKEIEISKKDTQPVTRPSGMVYHPREFAGQVDVKVIQKFREAGVPVFLEGYPGCGKTSLVEAAFTDEGGPITIAGHGYMETSDIIGHYSPKSEGGGYRWVDGPLIEAMRKGRVLFVDDATLIPATVLSRLYPVMDGRGVISIDEHDGEIVTAEPGFYVIGAHNPGVPGAVLSEALASRFALHIEVPTDFDLAIELGHDRKVVEAARKLTVMRGQDNGPSWAPAMREIIAFTQVKELLGREAALENLLRICPEEDRETVAVALGLSAATEALTLGGRL